jgi:hypothetical protein
MRSVVSPSRRTASVPLSAMRDAWCESFDRRRWPTSHGAPTVQRSAKPLKLKKVLRFGQSGCLLERRGGAEAALLTYRQMPRYRRQARREMPSFFILDWNVVRFMPRRAAAPEGPPITHRFPAVPAGYAPDQQLPKWPSRWESPWPVLSLPQPAYVGQALETGSRNARSDFRAPGCCPARDSGRGPSGSPLGSSRRACACAAHSAARSSGPARGCLLGAPAGEGR